MLGDGFRTGSVAPIERDNSPSSDKVVMALARGKIGDSWLRGHRR